MRIGVIENNQESPTRHISRPRADRFISREIAKWVVFGKVLKMLKDDSEIRGDIGYFQMRLDGVPRVKKPRRPEGLLLYYPHKDQESHGILRRCREQYA